MHKFQASPLDVPITTPHAIYLALCEIFGVICILLVIIVSLYHMIIVYKYNGVKLQIKMEIKLSFIFVIIAIIFNSNLCIYAFDVNSLFICYYGKYGGVPLYSLFKVLLYIILICRLWIVFKDHDEYRYNLNKLKILSVILILWCIINIILIITTSELIFIPDHRPICYIIPSEIALVSIGCLDITAGTINSILFIKPVLSMRSKQFKTEKERNIRNIAFKQCILSLIAIITSIIALIGIGLLSMPQVFAGTDVVVSTSCIILMFDWNAHIASKICCCLWCIPKQYIHLTKMENTQTTDMARMEDENL